MLSGHGGIGRRVRLRGVWLHRPSSSLGDRTTKRKHELFVLFLFLRTPRLACDTSHGAFLRNSDSVRLTASKERRKRKAFADIKRSGHSKQSKRDSVEPKAKCAARIV